MPKTTLNLIKFLPVDLCHFLLSEYQTEVYTDVTNLICEIRKLNCYFPMLEMIESAEPLVDIVRVIDEMVQGRASSNKKLERTIIKLKTKFIRLMFNVIMHLGKYEFSLETQLILDYCKMPSYVMGMNAMAYLLLANTNPEWNEAFISYSRIYPPIAKNMIKIMKHNTVLFLNLCRILKLQMDKIILLAFQTSYLFEIMEHLNVRMNSTNVKIIYDCQKTIFTVESGIKLYISALSM